MSGTLVSEVTGQGKDINIAYADACGKLLADAARKNQTATIINCTEYKELSAFKPAQRTTKATTAFKGQKKWEQTYAAYIMNEDTGLWMKAKLEEDVDVKQKAAVMQSARLLCLQYQCQTCVRVERTMIGDPNNQVEETFSPENIKLGTWNFKIEYAVVENQGDAQAG